MTLLLSRKLLTFVAVPARLGKSRDKLRSINLTEDGVRIVVGVSIASFKPKPVDAHNALFRLMRLLLSIPKPVVKESQDYGLFAGSQFNASALYHAIKPTGDEPMLQGEIDGLACSLRPFQVRQPFPKEARVCLCHPSPDMSPSHEPVFFCRGAVSSGCCNERLAQRWHLQAHPCVHNENALFQSLPVIDIGSGECSKIFVNQWTGELKTSAPPRWPQVSGGVSSLLPCYMLLRLNTCSSSLHHILPWRGHDLIQDALYRMFVRRNGTGKGVDRTSPVCDVMNTVT